MASTPARRRRQAAKAHLLDVLAHDAEQWDPESGTTAADLGVKPEDLIAAQVELAEQLRAWAQRIQPPTVYPR